MGVLLSRDCVVFFFKQKTAYEMRISDWSSDVCSSDLRDAPFHELGAGRADARSCGAQRNQGRGAGLQAAHCARLDAIRHNALHAPCACVERAYLVPAAAGLSDCPFPFVEEARLFAYPGAGGGRTELRSEEHTSELQSLMRNS